MRWRGCWEVSVVERETLHGGWEVGGCWNQTKGERMERGSLRAIGCSCDGGHGTGGRGRDV